jgi:hypothetical protein
VGEIKTQYQSYFGPHGANQLNWLFSKTSTLRAGTTKMDHPLLCHEGDRWVQSPGNQYLSTSSYGDRSKVDGKAEIAIHSAGTVGGNQPGHLGTQLFSFS